jgi:hypothetical protein
MQLAAVSKSAGTMFADNALEYLDYACLVSSQTSSLSLSFSLIAHAHTRLSRRHRRHPRLSRRRPPPPLRIAGPAPRVSSPQILRRRDASILPCAPPRQTLVVRLGVRRRGRLPFPAAVTLLSSRARPHDKP